VGDIPVESDWPRLRGDLPFGRAEEDAEMAAVNGGDTRGNGFGFERMIDRGENDSTIGDVDDGAAAGEIGDDFFFLLSMNRPTRRESGQENQEGANEEVPH